MTDTTLATPSPMRIVPREGHGISRKDISPNALRVLYRLREGGFAAYLVGGAVRDLLIGGHPKDFDVATDATPEQVKSLFRNCRLIGRRFRLAHVIYGRETIEVATFRSNLDDGSGSREMGDEGRIHRDNVYGTIEDDAVRRDFTANALYYAIEDFSVRDYVGGFEDVQARVLRLIGDPESRYREDPVRMLRAVRLSSKLDFSIEPAAAEPLARLSPLLSGAAPARLFDECLKMFMAGYAERSFLALERHGLLPALFGETAKALATNRSGALRGTLLGALRSTDARVQADKPVTPAFLFAALLWPAYCRELAVLQKSGVDALAAQQRAADRVTLHQAERIALPRRFSLPMQEIWLLQPRFQQRQRKRVFRLLAHPRFRAAFDFLELRAATTPELVDDLAFWREAQTTSPEHLAESLESHRGPSNSPRPPESDDALDEAAAPGAEPRRRRRRRRPPGVAAPHTTGAPD
jgi:poly(A) polymerase